MPGAPQHSLAWSLLPHTQPHAPAPGLLQRRLAAPVSPRQQPKLMASAMAGRGGRFNGAAVDSSGIFGSADLTAAAREEAALAAAAAAGAGLDPVSASQLLLQSLYEQRRLPPLQEADQQQIRHPLAPSGFGAGPEPATGPGPSVPQRQQQPQQVRRGFAAVQAPVPIPPVPAAAAGQSPSVSPLHALLASPSPQQRVLQQHAAAAAASPRQTWLGRSPSGRARVAELSVRVGSLSRENSAASAAQPPAAEGSGVTAAALPATAAAPRPPLLPHDLGSASGDTSLTEDLSESLLLQQLQGSQQLQSSGHAASSGQRGSLDGSGSDGPPEFF